MKDFIYLGICFKCKQSLHFESHDWYYKLKKTKLYKAYLKTNFINYDEIS